MQFHQNCGRTVAESVNEQTSFSSESKQEKLKMLRQLPFHKDKDFLTKIPHRNAHCVNSVY